MLENSTVSAGVSTRARRWAGAIAIVSLALAIVCFTVLAPWLHQLFVDLLHGDAPGWITQLATALQPRIVTDRAHFLERLPFVELMAQQLAHRAGVVFVLIALVAQFRLANSRKWYQRLWVDKQSALLVVKPTMAIVRAFIILVLICLCVELGPELWKWRHYGAFYRPTSIMKLLPGGYPAPVAILLVWSSWALGALLLVLRPSWLWPVALYTFVTFSLGLGYSFGFEKVNHSFTLMYWTLFLLLFAIHAGTKGRAIPYWPIFYAQIFICGAYFFSGMEKILYSHLSFASADNLKAILLYRHTTAGDWLVRQYWPLHIGAPAVVILQVAMPLALLVRRYRSFALLAGLVLHLSIAIFMGHWGFLFLWPACYFVFLLDRYRVDKVRGL